MARRGRPPHADVLTKAEWRVAEAVRHGLSNPRIARLQGISVNAVKFHVANTLGKLGFVSRAQLRMWDGVRADSALKKRRPIVTSPATSNLGPLAQIARTVSNIEAAKAWYGDVLGLELLYAFPGMAFFRLGDARLYLDERAPLAPESTLYFRVEDIHAEHRRLAAQGVAFINAPHLIHRHPDGTEEWLANFRDPDGRPLALMAQVAHGTPHVTR
jgi:catechol 2,3-dioxygenase-like lactoylglutathione lyase family enzyme/DNA-binding CsgD family transcriptional regulator